tara:strand:+ start:1082 stop:2122 length:1041 start_codon:yes stop_codon:yes gene_type:complete
MKLKNFLKIKKNNSPILIAEISGNHCGKKSLFLKHIISAAKSGADLIKIQTYEPQDITINSRSKKFFINSGTWKGMRLWDIYKKAHTPFEWHKDAFALSKKMGVELFSSPFSIRAVDLLEKFNVKLYKIASFEITDLKLIDYVASKRKPIIISTGMATNKEIVEAISTIKKYHNKIILLYCVSGYPAKEKDVNLINLKNLKKKYGQYIVGLSDHTEEIQTSLTAVALGAEIIEKHYIISKKLNSLDKKFSINPLQMRELKEKTQSIYDSMGKIQNGPKKVEKNSLKIRRSLFAIKDIKKGEKFSKFNVGTFRPIVGLPANFYFKILGKISKKNIKKNLPIRKSSVF